MPESFGRLMSIRTTSGGDESIGIAFNAASADSYAPAREKLAVTRIKAPTPARRSASSSTIATEIAVAIRYGDCKSVLGWGSITRTGDRVSQRYRQSDPDTTLGLIGNLAIPAKLQ